MRRRDLTAGTAAGSIRDCERRPRGVPAGSVSPQNKRTPRTALGEGAIPQGGMPAPRLPVRPCPTSSWHDDFMRRSVGGWRRCAPAARRADGGRGFFLEQHRKHQQREKGHPGERRRFVGRAPQRSVQLRRGARANCCASNWFLSRSNSVSCVARNGAGGPARSSKRVSGAELGRHSCFVFVHVFPFVLVLVTKTENPRLTGNRGFLENLCCLNQKFVPTMPKRQQSRCPNGHVSIGWRVLQRWCKRGFHIQRRKETPFRAFVKLISAG